MTTMLNDLPTWLVAVLVVGGTTALTSGVLLVLRESIRRSLREMHNDVAGYIFAVIGVLYALLLGFVILASWEHFTAAEMSVHSEAAALSSLYSMSVGLPHGLQSPAQTELRTYTSLVVNKEWSAMAHGHDTSAVDASLNRLYHIYAKGGRAGVQDNVDNASLGLLNQVSSARSERLADATGFLNGIFWAVLFFGGGCTLSFGMLFYLENAGVQIVMMAILAALISSMLFLLIVIDHPFSGGVQVSSEALRIALENMH